MKRLSIFPVLVIALLITPSAARSAVDLAAGPSVPVWKHRTVTAPGGNVLQDRVREHRNVQADQLRQHQFRVTDAEGNLVRRGGTVTGSTADGEGFRHQRQWRRSPAWGGGHGERSRGFGFGGPHLRGPRSSRP